MDEKTERLRDLFVDVTDEETVTESQAEARGSLTGGSGDDDLTAVVAKMRDRFEFTSALDDEELAAVVRGFYDGDDDDAIATDLDRTEDAVFEARMDLHLLREDDTDVDLGALRDRIDAGDDAETAAAALDVEVEAVRRACRVLQARDRARRSSQRFRTAFEERVTDADISGRLTESATEDGLDEAAEDIETNVDF